MCVYVRMYVCVCVYSEREREGEIVQVGAPLSQVVTGGVFFFALIFFSNLSIRTQIIKKNRNERQVRLGHGIAGLG
jgi:hypothetical protein